MADYELRNYEAAFDAARVGLAEGGIPIGSALCEGPVLLGVGHNKRVQQGDTTSHAEIDCIRSVGRRSSYSGTTLYTTCTPCYLCSGAAVLFKIPRIVIGSTLLYDGEGSMEFLRQHGVEIRDLQHEESYSLLKRYIEINQEIWFEDIGVAK